jgi:16S rRNA (guanine527-N7)-methyltransferase
MAKVAIFSGPMQFQAAFAVSRETIEKLETYAALLKQWQKAVQLVAPGTLDDIWHRHLADSAQLLAIARPDWRHWIDLGSGAGFPGLVIAVMSAQLPGQRVTLIESDSRKAAFLAEVARKTGAPVDIIPARIESSSTHVKVKPGDVISARALAPLAQLLALAAPYQAPGCQGLFLKGRDADLEVEDARKAWQFELVLKPSLTDASGRILVVKNLVANPEG